MSYRRSVSFLIVCPLKPELEALAKVFKFGIGNPSDGIVPGLAYTYVAELDGKKIIVMKLSRAGVLSAACETAHALQHIEPGCIVSFGIAGKLSSDVNLEDVVFADTVSYYEPAKESVVTNKIKKGGKQIRMKESIFIPRTDPVSTDARLGGVLRGVPVTCWHDFNVCIGPIASGEKLIADIASVTRKRIKYTLNDKCLAVEMEAAGVAAAVKWFQSLNSDEPIPAFIALKGLSDDATVKKSLQSIKKTESGEHPVRKKAAENAAQVLFELVGRANTVLNQPLINKLGQIKQTFVSVDSALSPITASYRQVELGRLLHTAKRRIPVFYHWKQLTPGLHWIDFLHLTVLRRFPTKYFQPRPLVTVAEGEDPQRLRWMIENVCGEQPTFSGRMIAERNNSNPRAEILGWDHNAYIEAREKHVPLDVHNQGSPHQEGWMQYMVSESGEIGGCIVLVWDIRQPLYEALFRSYSINSCLAVSGDILLGEKKGKFEGPGENLVMEPGEYSAIREWAQKANPEDVSEFALKFSHDIEKWSEELTKSDAPPTRTHSQSSPMDIVNEVIAAWDYLYFKNDNARAT